MTWEAGWRYGIISTVPYEQQKIYWQIILFQRIYYLSISLTGLPCHREPSIVLMSLSLFSFISIVSILGEIAKYHQPYMSLPSKVFSIIILDVDPQRDDEASPMLTYRWDLLECWFQLFSTSQIQFRTFMKKNQIFGSHVVVLEDLSVDVSITNVGLVLTKPGRFLFSGYGQNSISSISNFLKKITFLGFHVVVLVKTIPLMYQLLM